MPSVPSSYTLEANVAPVRELAGASSDYRALVCIFLFGGADAHNMVVPLTGNPNRAPYDAVRGVTGVAAASALPLGSTGWGLHPNMTDLQARYGAGGLAVLLNVGTLKAPTSRTSYFSGRVPLPEQLFSHNSQQLQWQAAPGLTQLVLDSGWMGRAAEFAGGLYNQDPLNNITPNFSVAGRLLQMQGFNLEGSVMQTTGAQAFGNGENRGVLGATFTAALNAARTRQEWNNGPQRLFAERVRRAVANQTALAANLATLPTTPNARFDALSTNSLAQQLRVVARIIASRGTYQHRRDLFIVSLGGFDNHENLNGQFPALMNTVDKAMGAFYLSMQDLGLQENVTAFTESDFGRTLVINTTLGSDHGWGGHHLVMGGAVQAGVYGSTDLTVNGPLDTGQGRIIPTTSLEQYYGTLLKWWGIPEAQLPVVLENVDAFSPRTLPMLREPATNVPAPAFSLDFMSSYVTGQRDARLTYDPGTGGIRTMFDKNGNLAVPPTNLIPRSNIDHVPMSSDPYTTSTVFNPAVSNSGSWTASAGQGISVQIVGGGVLPTGERYRDLRWFGTASSQSFPHLRFAAASILSSMAAVRPYARYLFSVKTQLIAGSLAGFGAGSTALGISLYNGAVYVSDHALGGTIPNMANGTLTRRRRIIEISNASGTHAVPQMIMSVPPGGTVDVTIRVAEPMFELCIERLSHAGDTVEAVPAPSTYIETNGTPFNGPRCDHDPVTLRPRGVRLDRSVTNSVANSMFTTAVVGTPGALPAGMSTFYGNGMTGGNISVVRSGVERGIPFVDVRFWGTASIAATAVVEAVAGGTPIAAAATSFWNFSCYLALKAGRLPTGVGSPQNHKVEVNGRIGTTFDTGSSAIAGSVFDALIDAPITHQRFQAPFQLSASANGVSCRLSVSLALNETFDFTLRIGAPQLSSTDSLRNAASFIPTWGTASSIGNESLRVTGSNFSSWYAPGASTLAVVGASDCPAVTGISAPILMVLNDGTSANRIGLAHIADTATANGTLWSGGAQQFVTSAISSMRAGSKITEAMAAATNDAQFAARGVVGTVDTTIAMPTVNSITFGGSNANVDSTVWLQRCDVWNQRLDAAQLSLVTAQ